MWDWSYRLDQAVWMSRARREYCESSSSFLKILWDGLLTHRTTSTSPWQFFLVVFRNYVLPDLKPILFSLSVSLLHIIRIFRLSQVTFFLCLRPIMLIGKEPVSSTRSCSFLEREIWMWQIAAAGGLHWDYFSLDSLFGRMKVLIDKSVWMLDLWLQEPKSRI